MLEDRVNKLSLEKRTQIVAMLVEGNSINSTCHMSGASKNTILKLLTEVGAACATYQDHKMTEFTCKKIQCNEIWSFVGMKQKNVPEEVQGVFGFGDVYTWTAIDADTKLIPCWHVGTRCAESAQHFVSDLASRLANHAQLTTDGHKMYINAVEDAFKDGIDYTTIINIYGNDGVPKEASRPRCYNPAECTGTEKRQINRSPDLKHVSTSYVERANLTMRMNMRRFTWLTNAFSKKLENHMAAISLHLMHYNFCRIHKTLRVTPAMEAGLSDHVWDLEEVLIMVENNCIAPKNKGSDPKAWTPFPVDCLP